MPLDPAILDALDEILSKEPQQPELQTQMKQLVANWFERNASEDDVARLIKRVRVHIEQQD
jgi:hypothetical protein